MSYIKSYRNKKSQKKWQVIKFANVVRKEISTEIHQQEKCVYDEVLVILKMGPKYDLGKMTYIP